MRRAKKIAIVVTILAVGTAVALCFRKPAGETAQKDNWPAAGKAKTEGNLSEAHPTARPSPRGTAYQPHDATEAEPKLAGRIEPVTSAVLPIETAAATQTRNDIQALNSGHATSLEKPGATMVETAKPPNTVANAVFPQGVRRPLGWREPMSSLQRGANSLKDSADSGESAIAMVPAGKHKIVDGDTLANLAARYLGNSARAPDIYDYNRDVLTSVELLPIGKELRIPPHEYRRLTVESDVQSINTVERRTNLELVPILAAETASRISTQASIDPPTVVTQPKSIMPPATGSTYVVQPYDTLALISRRIYGDLAHQNAIIAANSQQLKTAKDLRPGMTLVLPRRNK
jgi:nucleoid-associated protein YgaU